MSTIINSIFPVFIVIAMGSLLRRLNFVEQPFFKVSDRLVYFIFFPTMLFWKIGNPASAAHINWNLNLAVLSSIFVIYVMSLAVVKLSGMSAYRVGSFSQCCYRFNTYIGMAIVIGIYSEQEVRIFGLIIAFAIPFINLLAVSTLIWFSKESYALDQKSRFMLRAVLSNPLIIACLVGLAYSKLGWGFPLFLNNTFALLSSVTLPLALLSIGNSLTFSGLRENLTPAMLAASCKLLTLPLVGYFFMRAFHVTGIYWKVAMIYFLLPTSTAIYILSAQLDSDIELASAGILLSTLLSMFSLSIGLLLLSS